MHGGRSMNCLDCQHYQDDEEEVRGYFYCTWQRDWIPKKWINGCGGCPGHLGKVEIVDLDGNPTNADGWGAE